MKKHPHKRAVDKDKRKKLWERGKSWWRRQDKEKAGKKAKR